MGEQQNFILPGANEKLAERMNQAMDQKRKRQEEFSYKLILRKASDYWYYRRYFAEQYFNMDFHGLSEREEEILDIRLHKKAMGTAFAYVLQTRISEAGLFFGLYYIYDWLS